MKYELAAGLKAGGFPQMVTGDGYHITERGGTSHPNEESRFTLVPE
jgi:hypothetical protein